MNRPIAISLSPNTEKDDVLLALKTLFAPVQWFNFRHTEELENEFAKYFGNGYWALAVNSGRSALYMLLKTLDLQATDKISLQALTCVAVPNAIIWAGARPLYIDVDDNFNIDVNDLMRKITSDVKAVIVQHTFGIPANIDALKIICKKHKILLIEDCAVSIGATYRKKPVGKLGDTAFFSFGRDKVISSVFGGMIVGKNRKMYNSLLAMRDELAYPPVSWFLQQLLHPVLFSLILPLYNVGIGKLGIGKALIYLFQKLHILAKPVYPEEESGFRPKFFPMKMPGGLSLLALKQFKKLARFNEHRSKIAKLYFEKLTKENYILPKRIKGSIWLRFPLLSNRRDEILKKARSRGILLGDWYKKPVVPVKDLYRVGYSKGSCPNAESISNKILNLPTYPSLKIKEAERVVELLNE